MRASAPVVRGDEAPWETTGEGVRRQILGFGTDLMLVRVEFQKGASGALHHHQHRQATYVAAGSFQVTIGEEIEELNTGDCFFAESDVPHAVHALEAGMLIDTFTPCRLDFLRTTT